MFCDRLLYETRRNGVPFSAHVPNVFSVQHLLLCFSTDKMICFYSARGVAVPRAVRSRRAVEGDIDRTGESFRIDKAVRYSGSYYQ
jgi:hypothetical protein